MNDDSLVREEHLINKHTNRTKILHVHDSHPFSVSALITSPLIQLRLLFTLYATLFFLFVELTISLDSDDDNAPVVEEVVVREEVLTDVRNVRLHTERDVQL